MQKPIYLWPFIFVYRLVFWFLKLPFRIIRYFTIGTIYTINFIVMIVELFLHGVIWSSYFVYCLFKYFLNGIYAIFVLLTLPFRRKTTKTKETISEVKQEEPIKVTNEEIEDIVENSIEDEKEEIIVNEIEEPKNIIEQEIQKIEKEPIDYSNLVITEKELLKAEQEKLKIQKTIIKEQTMLAKQEKEEEKTRIKEAARILKEERKKEKKRKENDSYINDKVEIKKQSIFAGIPTLGKKILAIPKGIINKINNNDFIKHSRNQKEIKREAMLINFEGEDAEKSDVKILYEYVAKNPEGKVIKGYFDAFSKVEVHSYLLSEGFEVYSIKTNKWIQLLHGRDTVNHVKIKVKDLIFFITQLSTYLKAGIPLVEALRILSRQFKQKKYKKIFEGLVYDLTTGENFSEAMMKQNVAFPRLLINMVKTAEMTGELPEVLDDMSDYYTQTEKTRKQMITALMYPSLVFIFSVAVITFIMMFVIPQFVGIYETMDASQIPGFTLAVIAVSEFIQEYIVWLLIGIFVFILIFMYLYNNVKIFRAVCQWILMHVPIIGTSVIYSEVAMFTKTFASLLSHNVFITESMEILNKITNNEIYKMLILDTITNLGKGEKISKAFEGHWAFPVPAYEMLVTGEKTGELAEMMGKVAAYYQDLHRETVTRIKTFIEPILTIFLTVVVGIIILAVIIPMFSLYGSIQSYG